MNKKLSEAIKPVRGRKEFKKRRVWPYHLLTISVFVFGGVLDILGKNIKY